MSDTNTVTSADIPATHRSPAMQALINEYANRVPAELGDATEALTVTRDYALRGYLSRFIVRWEATEALEAGKFGPEGSDAEVMARALLDISNGRSNAGDVATAALRATQAVRS